MSYDPDDLRNGRKAILRGRIVTPIDMSGAEAKIAEDGKWYLRADMSLLAEEQLREELVQNMSNLVEGKQITTMKAKGRGVEFILDDNTRVSLDYSPQNLNLKLMVTDPEGKRIL